MNVTVCEAMFVGVWRLFSISQHHLALQWKLWMNKHCLSFCQSLIHQTEAETLMYSSSLSFGNQGLLHSNWDKDHRLRSIAEAGNRDLASLLYYSVWLMLMLMQTWRVCVFYFWSIFFAQRCWICQLNCCELLLLLFRWRAMFKLKKGNAEGNRMIN